MSSGTFKEAIIFQRLPPLMWRSRTVRIFIGDLLDPLLSSARVLPPLFQLPWQIHRTSPDSLSILGPPFQWTCIALSDMYLCFPYHFVIIDNIVKAFCRKQWVITIATSYLSPTLSLSLSHTHRRISSSFFPSFVRTIWMTRVDPFVSKFVYDLTTAFE